VKSKRENHHPGRYYLIWIDTGLKLPPSIQIKRVRSKCDINAGEVLMSLFFFLGSVKVGKMKGNSLYSHSPSK
jgi:hypothetical protein